MIYLSEIKVIVLHVMKRMGKFLLMFDSYSVDINTIYKFHIIYIYYMFHFSDL